MHRVEFTFPTGIQVQCKVSGIKGTLTSRIQRINGCIQYCVDPKMKEDAALAPDGAYVDGIQLEVLGEQKEFPKEHFDFQFAPGDRVKSRINGFKGIVQVARLDMNGCEHYHVEAEEMSKEHKRITHWFFMQELEKIDDGLNAKPKESVVSAAVKKVTGKTETENRPYQRSNTGSRPMKKERL